MQPLFFTEKLLPKCLFCQSRAANSASAYFPRLSSRFCWNATEVFWEILEKGLHLFPVFDIIPLINKVIIGRWRHG